jgi:hypothetical protein
MKKSIIYSCLIGLGIVSVASCSDPMDEITEVIFDREFSPINLEAKNIKESYEHIRRTFSQDALEIDSYFAELCKKHDYDPADFTTAKIVETK